MNSLNNILELLITRSGLSENELARRMNITVATLNKIKTGVITNPTLQTLRCIAQHFGITIDQLLGNAPLDNFFSKNLYCIPFVDIENIADLDISNLNFTNHAQWKRIELIAEESKNHKLFATTIFGEAMLPLVDKETIVVIDKDEIPKNKSLVLVYIAHLDELLLRRMLVDGSFKILKPINSSFPEIRLSTADKILSVVIATIKEHNKK